LEPGATFLNHCSFGACPKEVLAVQAALREEMERQPDQFFRRKVFPHSPDNALQPAAERLARFVGTTGERLVFVTNATEAVNIALHAVDLEPGDEILVFDCVYNAVRLAAELICRRHGARVVQVALPVPLTANDVVGRIAEAAGPRTKLAIIDHISSPTATVFPITEITRALKEEGVKVMIDGAHAVGQLALDLPSIGADWYTANAHKWLYAPKGTAFLYAAAEVALRTVPLSVSHWHALGFPRAFDYVATRDVTGFLSVPAAIDFIERLGVEKVRAYLSELSRAGAGLMRELGAEAVAPDAMFAAMRAYILPQMRAAKAEDAVQLMTSLWDEHRIQAASNVFQGKLLLRLSAQIYLDRADVERAVQVIARAGWPGRA
jgi:isopenicillin-N epimerase